MLVEKALVRRGGRGLYVRRLPAQQLVGDKGRTLPEYLEAAEVVALVRAAPSVQAALVMLLQWRAGLRVSEALAVEAADLTLDGERPTLRVRRGKGGKARLVPVHPELGAALRTALAYGGRRQGPLVPAARSTAWRWVKDALRHSAARHWLASGIPINVVSRWLGHASLQTTLVYLEVLPDPLGDMARVPNPPSKAPCAFASAIGRPNAPSPPPRSSGPLLRGPGCPT